MLFIDGQEAKLTLDELVAKGRELIAAGYPQTTQTYDQETNEAITACHWYEEQHREWVEAQRGVSR